MASLDRTIHSETPRSETLRSEELRVLRHASPEGDSGTRCPSPQAPSAPVATASPSWPLRVWLQCERVQVGRWHTCRWEAVAVESVRETAGGHNPEGEGWVATPGLALYRDETAAYRFNLSSSDPRLFVVCSESQEETEVPEVLLVTASQDRAADYLDGDDQAVHSLPMPEAVQCWVEAFIGRAGEPDLGLERGKRRRRRTAQSEQGVGNGQG